MSGASQSAVIVTVPAAEEVVGRHRARFDVAAGWGVPAHVTVLYPFVPPSDLDPGTVERLAAAVGSVPRFHATWDTTGWFGTDVLWLSPRPAEPFTTLTSAVVSAFPACPPYGGEYDDVVPHLTVGHGVEGSNLRDVERQVLPHLPIHMEVTTAGLWVGSDAPGSWAQAAALPLG